MTPPRRERTELQTEHDAGELIYRLSHTIGDTISATSHTSMVGFAAMLGLEVPGYLLPQREWWRRYRITSGQNPVVEHDSLLSFIRAESPRGLTRGSGKPERTLALLFALVDESEDKELGARVLKYLEEHGVTRDAITTAEVRPAGKVRGGRRNKGETLPLLSTDTRELVAATSSLAKIDKDEDISPTKTGVSNQRLAARLKRDHPELAARVQAGGLSIRDAAREAGMKLPVVLTIGRPATLAKRILAEKGPDYARELADALLAAIG